MATKSRAIANAVVAINQRGNFVFNDKLVDGTRSLKVWGWKLDDYTLAQKLLEDAGCRVTRVKTPGIFGRSGSYRLHVVE